MPAIVPLVLGSAAIGALVSSIITLVGQAVERKARQRELLLAKSIELAELHTNLIKAAVEMSGRNANMYPHIVHTRWFYKELEGLLRTGKLTPGMEENYQSYFSSPR